MGSYPDEFPFGIMEVVNLLNLRIEASTGDSVYVDCPFCSDHQGRMNVNFSSRNVWAVQLLQCTWRNAGAVC